MSPEKSLEDRIMEAVLRSAFLYHGQVVGFEASRVREAIREELKGLHDKCGKNEVIDVVLGDAY